MEGSAQETSEDFRSALGTAMGDFFYCSVDREKVIARRSEFRDECHCNRLLITIQAFLRCSEGQKNKNTSVTSALGPTVSLHMANYIAARNGLHFPRTRAQTVRHDSQLSVLLTSSNPGNKCQQRFVSLNLAYEWGKSFY